MDWNLLSPTVLQNILEAGVVVAATAGVEEATKDAYTAVKEKFKDIFGRSGDRALNYLEINPQSDDAKRQIVSLSSAISKEDLIEFRPSLQNFWAAVEKDAVASTAIKQAQINLDIDVGETANIEDLENVDSISVKAKTGKDFNLKRMTMTDRSKLGK